MRGWFGLHCWNGLNPDQQRRLIEKGTLEFGERAIGGRCSNGAAVAIETQTDEAPGPRFYCHRCAIDYLNKEIAEREIA